MTATLVAVLLCCEIKSSFKVYENKHRYERISRLQKLTNSKLMKLKSGASLTLKQCDLVHI